MFEELGIGDGIDHATQQHPEPRFVPVGTAVTAMGLNGLGFVNQQLSLVPLFFPTKPTPRLVAPGINAEHLNDEALGRALETLYAYGVTALYRLIAATAAERLGLAPRFAHLDSTSFHLDGRYNSDEGPDAQGIHIPRDDSRDHRPDLHHVMLALIVAAQAGISVLMQPLSGNSRDAKDFGEVVSTPIDQLPISYGTTSLVADSALYSADTLPQLAKPRMKWIPRVPGTLSEAQARCTPAAPALMTPLEEG
jgi:transposase